MLSGALGLQIIFRRLGVELGEQQFSKIKGVDERELTFREIKNLSSEHLILCRAVKTNITGLSETIVKQPMLAHLNNGRFAWRPSVQAGVPWPGHPLQSKGGPWRSDRPSGALDQDRRSFPTD